LPSSDEIICHVRYELDLAHISLFKQYARTWEKLIRKYGGFHFGFFIPNGQKSDAAISFPGVGLDAPNNIAVALYSFPNRDAYDNYRRTVGNDLECILITKLVNDQPCFVSYERAFLSRAE
jgi:hypothetical protein